MCVTQEASFLRGFVVVQIPTSGFDDCDDIVIVLRARRIQQYKINLCNIFKLYRSKKTNSMNHRFQLSTDKPNDWSDLPLYKKIQWYGSHLTPQFHPYVDKLSAKEIVENTRDESGAPLNIKCAEVVRVLKSHKDITQKDINSRYILKSSHGSGWNYVMPNNTSNVSVSTLLAKLHKWNKPYYREGEVQYNTLKPRFYIERKIQDKLLGVTGEAINYMFRCIHGEPISVGVKHIRSQNTYTLDWKPFGTPELEFHCPKPDKLDEMLNIARVLSKPFEFVRIDLYLGETDIYFSEFTFTPAGGNQVYPDDIEAEFGKLWT